MKRLKLCVIPGRKDGEESPAQKRGGSLAALGMTLVLFVTCRETKTIDRQAYHNEIESWQRNRSVRLQAEDGWLSLIGLFWLNDGANSAPASTGVLILQNGKVTLQPDPKANLTIDGKPVTAPVELKNDVETNGPTVVAAGSMRYQIIKRGDRFAVRVKDPHSEARTHFRGLEYYPVDPKWRVEAKLETHDPPKKIPITNIVGQTSDEPSPGTLVFTLEGKTYRLDPILEQGETDYFIIFKDETSRDATYPAGRYLYASPAGPDGTVIVDFNKAYNPPCAFTPFATCPLPPLQNRMPIRIDAGEKKYAGSHA